MFKKEDENMEDSNLKTAKESWTIYVDETYLEPNHRMVTAFWAINRLKEEKSFLKISRSCISNWNFA